MILARFWVPYSVVIVIVSQRLGNNAIIRHNGLYAIQRILRILIYILLKRYAENIHRKNDFAEESKNLAKYRSKNNFVWIIKIIM